MAENIFGFIALVVFVVIVFMTNYHSRDIRISRVTGIAGMFGLALLVWWIIKFVLLGILIK